jgi:hypothetical protein
MMFKLLSLSVEILVGDQVHTTHLLEELTCAGEVCTMEETLLIHCENSATTIFQVS